MRATPTWTRSWTPSIFQSPGCSLISASAGEAGLDAPQLDQKLPVLSACPQSGQTQASACAQAMQTIRKRDKNTKK